jgi:hypothetical protein
MRMIRGAVLLLALTACQGNEASTASPVPKTVSALISNPFPDDGNIHVLGSRGKFVVGDKTPVCSFPEGFSIDSRTFFSAFGQTWVSPGGSDRQVDVAVATQCPQNPEAVLIKGTNSPNRSGKPYKLLLAVWQGNVAGGKGAYWVGGIERDADPRNAETWGEMPWRMGKPRIEDAIELATIQLSRKFVQSLGSRKPR